jgi:predicted PurR-regulated permease PerM
MSERVHVDVTSNTIFRAVLILLAFWLLYVVLDIVIMLFAAVILASVIEPIANFFQKYKVPRGVTVAVVYLILITALTGAVTIMLDPLVQQSRQLAKVAPQFVETAYDYIGVAGAQNIDVIASLQNAFLRVGDNLANISSNIFQGTRSFFSGLLTILFVFILAFYLVVERDALKKFFRLITPKEHLPYVEKVVDRATTRVGRWLLAQIALGIIIGIIVGIGLWALGVQYALLLGLASGLLEIIPMIGPIIAAIPGVLVALSQSLWLGVAVLVFYLAVQQFENNILIPKLMRKALGLNPIVTLVAILLGARLAGVVGMLLAVPLASILSVIMADVFGKNKIKEAAEL